MAFFAGFVFGCARPPLRPTILRVSTFVVIAHFIRASSLFPQMSISPASWPMALHINDLNEKLLHNVSRETLLILRFDLPVAAFDGIRHVDKSICLPVKKVCVGQRCQITRRQSIAVTYAAPSRVRFG